MTITFVCTGNASRSPFAEAVMKKLLAENKLSGFEINSVGTKNLHNEPRNPEMVAVAKELGYTLNGVTRHISEEDISKSDLILIMSPKHYDKLTEILPKECWGKIKLFNKYCFEDDTEVPDPYYQPDKAAYRQAADKIIAGCMCMIDRLKANHN
ncbi:low molecular weight phosphotyrosine protein phosphatase [Palleniella muris]|uniref:Low molecular weight phosphotyrosine protein phosphatase n=1 Tax=Palleniella muris TaxID=3038145 RepID=A0AC61QND6_9BACT|nr:low molecular weight protein-tyrosine-phosphatase [Palleniella muris]TGX81175.1 low molecular weight phosphotyrosine protein phosphatase [Palleniella muris]